jgi:hypothetical protein
MLDPIVWPRPAAQASGMSIFIWAMVGIAFWHFAVLVPDRFWGGIIGAFLAALAGALGSGFVLPAPGLSSENPPGLLEGFAAMPGSLLALAWSYWYGARREAATRLRVDVGRRDEGREGHGDRAAGRGAALSR